MTQNSTNVRYNVSKPWSAEVDVVDPLRRPEASLSCCCCARWRFCTGLIGRLNIVIIIGGVLRTSIAKLFFELLVLSTQLSNLVRLLDRTVVVSFANNELTFLRMSTSATCRARLRSIALKLQSANTPVQRPLCDHKNTYLHFSFAALGA
jgi:hypothetical protein